MEERTGRDGEGEGGSRTGTVLEGGDRVIAVVVICLLDNVPLELVGKVARAGAVAEPGHVESGAVARHGENRLCRTRFAVAVDDDRWQA